MKKFKVYDTSAYVSRPLLDLLTEFHNKFGTPYDGEQRHLSKAESAFRMECHREEAKEYADACEAGNIVEALDALADELYFLTGTAHRQGFGLDVTEVNVNLGGDGVQPHLLPRATLDLRLERHAKVLHNYESRVIVGDLTGQALALNEAIRAFRATAQMHCFDIDEALRRVHAANMTKDVDPAKQRRTQALRDQGLEAGHLLEITKPDGWLPPYLGDLCGLGPYSECQGNAAFCNCPECGDKPDDTDEAYALDPTPSKPVFRVPNLCGLLTIDGPDASGKSTLAARIAEVTGGQVIHLTWSKQLEACMDEYRIAALNYARVLARHCVVILERPWLSHPIYAEVYRGGVFNQDDVTFWKNFTEENALLNIIALPGNEDEWYDHYKQMCGQRVELHGPNEAKARAVFEGFRDAFTGAAGVERQPRNVEVYDMQQHLGEHTADDNLDAYIDGFILPALEVKE